MTTEGKEPNATARVAARQMWDMFQALCEEGFSEDQALHIISLVIAGAYKDKDNQ